MYFSILDYLNSVAVTDRSPAGYFLSWEIKSEAFHFSAGQQDKSWEDEAFDEAGSLSPSHSVHFLSDSWQPEERTAN